MAEKFVNSSRTTLNGAIDNAQTTITVANSTGFPNSGTFRIRIDSEIMTVTGVAANVWTVTRASEAVQGVQVARAHADKAAVAFRLTAGSLATIGGSSFDPAGNLFIGGGGTSVTGNVPGDLGTDNIGIGGQSIDNGTIEPALNAVTDGLGNIAIGPSALKNVTTGNYNVGIGEATLLHVTTGEYNVVLGGYAGSGLTTGEYNVCVLDVGVLTTGDGNIILGAGSIGNGSGLVTGSNNILIGAHAFTSKADLSQSIAIGNNAQVKNNNQCVIGGTGADAVCIAWSGATAPADADIVAGQCFLFFDFTNGAPLMKAKGKTLDGTVYNKTLTWT